MDKDEMKMIDITDDLKDLNVEETRKMAEEFNAKLNKKLEDWFYNLPSIEQCAIEKALLEKRNATYKEKDKLNKQLEQAEQEAAREIFQELKKEGIMYRHFASDEHLAISMEKLKVIANKYGIKVEDVWEIEL